MLKFALILAVLPALAFAGRISFTACNGAGGPLPEWAAVEGCDENSCTVVNGAPVHLSALLVPTVNAEAITTRLTAQVAIIGTLEMDLPPEVVDGCNAFEDGCPITVGEEKLIATSFAVTSPLNNINPTIEYIMTNEAGQRVMCVRTRVNLVAA